MNVRDALDGSKRRKTSGEIRNAIDVNPVPQPCIRVGTDRYDFSSRVSDPTVEGETKVSIVRNGLGLERARSRVFAVFCERESSV